MLLTITTTHQPANDLGFLLHKHPERFQSFDMSFGKVHVYYPEVSAEQCSACLLLDVDAVGMVRGKNADQNFLLAQYVNDRPYAASSFMSVAIAQVFGSALQGRCKDRPEWKETSGVSWSFKPSLYRLALSRLVQEEEPEEAEEDDQPKEKAEEVLEKPISLNEQRLGAVVASLRASGAKRVLDLGCGEGKLIRELLKDKQFEEIVGLDVSIRALEIAQRRLKVDRLPTMQANRLKLIHGSLMYRDKRLEGFDAAAVVEVVEHLDPPRLSAFERVLFEFSRPRTVVLTTPNREYNVTWETLPAGEVREPDHRFEWTRQEFQSWASGIAARFGYDVRFLPVGPEH